MNGFRGSTLNAGCGSDPWGDVRVDLRGRPTVLADIECLPFRGRVFDKIKLREVLEHLVSPLFGLRELKRVMRGWMYISVPNMYFIWRIALALKERRGIPVDVGTTHLQEWDMITMKQLLERAGFTVVWDRFNWHTRYMELCVVR